MATNLVTSLIIRLVDQVTAPVRRLVKGFTDIERTAKQASKAFALSANLKHSADNLKAFSQGVVGLVEAPVKKFMDFEEQMSSVKAATFDLTKSMDPAQTKAMAESVGELSAKARELGASTKFSATEVAGGMDILAKNFAGEDLQKAKDIAAAMPGILSVAAATRESIAATSDITTAAMNQFGLQAADMGTIGDMFVKTANTSATGLLDLGEAMKYSGVSAKNANVDMATTLAMLGALGNAGKKGSVAGTGLASVLGNMQSGMKKQRGALAALGINVADRAGNMRPIVDLLAEIDRAADKKFGGKGKGGVKRDRWLQGLVGMGSDKESLAILTKQAGSGELQKLVEANRGAGGTAKKVAEEMGNNAAGAAKNLQSAYEELQLTIGEQLIPKVTELIKWVQTITSEVTSWAKAHPDLVRNLGLVVGILGGFGLVMAPVLQGVAAMVTLLGSLGKVVGVVFKLIKAHPFIALATAAMLIIEYWEPIKSFFSTLWDGITAAFKVALDWIIGKIEWVMQRVAEAKEAIMNPVGTTTAVIRHIEAIKAQGLLLGFGMLPAIWDTPREPDQAAANDPAQVAQLQDWAANLTRGAAARIGELGQAAAGPPAANGPPAAGEGPSPFTGELKITVNNEGKVTKQELQTRGDPGFAVRMNAGAQR